MSTSLLKKQLSALAPVTQDLSGASGPAAAAAKDKAKRLSLKREQLKVKKQIQQEANKKEQAQKTKLRNLNYFASTSKTPGAATELMQQVGVPCSMHVSSQVTCSIAQRLMVQLCCLTSAAIEGIQEEVELLQLSKFSTVRSCTHHSHATSSSSSSTKVQKAH